MCQKINLELLNKNSQPKVKMTIFDIRKIKKKSFICPKGCGKVFTQKSNLNTHIRIHTGDKPYKCDYFKCGKKFTTLGNLRAHQSLHSGTKLFKCEFPGCDKQYFLNYRLRIHSRTHLTEKPFKCDVCDKRFNEKGNVKIHMRIHTGERPFSCRLCLKTFRTQSHLKDHTKRHGSNLEPDVTPSTKTSVSHVQNINSSSLIESIDNSNCTVKNTISTWDLVNSEGTDSLSGFKLNPADSCSNNYNSQSLYFQEDLFEQLFWNNFQSTFMYPSNERDEFNYQGNF